MLARNDVVNVQFITTVQVFETWIINLSLDVDSFIKRKTALQNDELIRKDEAEPYQSYNILHPKDVNDLN